MNLENFVSSLNWLDYCFLAVLLISMIFGLRRGFVREVVSLIFWILALALPTFLGPVLAPSLSFISKNQSVQIGASFAFVFVVVFIVGFIVNFMLRKVVDHSSFSGANRFGGLIFGLFRGVAILAVIVSFVGLTTFTNSKSWQNSAMVPSMQNAIYNVLSKFPSYQDNSVYLQQKKLQDKEHSIL